MVPAPPADGSGTEPARRPGIHELGRPEVTELEIGRTTHKVAPVEPLDVDGVATMMVGTFLWAVVAVTLAVLLPDLRKDGTVWWLWTAVTGAGLGVLGTIYCKRRVKALAKLRTPRSAP